MKHRFHVDARSELFEATRYYEGCRVGLGDEFLTQIDAAISTISETPNRWPEMEPGIRKYRLHRFPYALLYRTLSVDVLEILVVMDLRRRPGYWHDRR